MIRMTEEQFQCAVKDFADLHLLPMLHIPNEGVRTKYAGYRLKKQGMMPGAADCFFIRSNAKYHGLWLELKIPPNKPSDTQLCFLRMVNAEGYLGLVAYDIREAVDIISEFYEL